MFIVKQINLILVALALLVACASDKTIIDEGAENAQKSVATVPVNSNVLANDLEQEAKDAIAKAVEAGAEEEAITDLNKAYGYLGDAQELGVGADPIARRDLLESSINSADKAFNTAIIISGRKWIRQIKDLDKDLVNLEAESRMPRYYNRSLVLGKQMERDYEAANYNELIANYRLTYPAMLSMRKVLDANISIVNMRKQEAEGYLDEAEKVNAKFWAEEEYKEANDLYAIAVRNLAEGDLEAAEFSFNKSIFYSKVALRRTARNENLDQLDNELYSVMRSLERASQRQVEDSSNSPAPATSAPWSGKPFLDENPLVDFNSEVVYEEPGSLLGRPEVGESFFETGQFPRTRDLAAENARELDLRRRTEAEALEPLTLDLNLNADQHLSSYFIDSAYSPVSAVMQAYTTDDDLNLEFEDPTITEFRADETPSRTEAEGSSERLREAEPRDEAGEFPVSPLAEARTVDANPRNNPIAADTPYEAELLEEARIMWENGVLARNEGRSNKAFYYFNEAKEYIKNYNVRYGNKSIYIVKDKVPADCLWRIAALPEIYGDPYKWPRIYERNRDIIANPSLIYIGQELVIPPLD